MGAGRSITRPAAIRITKRPPGGADTSARLELASKPAGAEVAGMNLPETEQDFLRELVKMSRQRSHHVRWTDRDGTERITTLGQADVVRVNRLAQQLGLSKEALFKQASHLSAARRPSAAPAPLEPPTDAIG